MKDIKKDQRDMVDQGGITVSMSKLVDGIATVFAGVVDMLGALDAGTAKKITAGFAQESGAGDRQPMQEKKGGTNSGAEEADGTVGTGADVAADTAHAAADAPLGADVPAPAVAEETAQRDVTVPSVTVDDVARVVVRKVKANPGINDKVRALVNAHGAQRVTELKPETFEAFLTDLAQL